MENELFRKTAVENQTRRLHGNIVLKSSFATRIITLAILAVVSVAVALVASARYARTEPAKGILVTTAGSSKIYGMHAGVVKDIMVKEGDYVKIGQRLALVTVETPNAAGAFGTIKELESLRTQRSLANNQMGLSRERTASDVEKLRNVAQGLEAQISTIDDQINLQQEVVSSTTATFEQLKGVVDRGFVSKLEYERRKQSALAARQDLSRLKQQRGSLRSDVIRTRQELNSSKIDGLNQEESSRSSMEVLHQQELKIESQSSYLVESPIAGRVTAIQTGIGQTVNNSIPMLIVVPYGLKLSADIYVPSRSIGFIAPGQEVRLLYDAFPYQRFGSYRARIDTISQVSVAGIETNAPFKIDEPVYKVTATPLNQNVMAYGKPVALQPGMTLIANIVLERQTFVDWLLSPLHAVANRD